MAGNPWDFAKENANPWDFAATAQAEKDMDPVTHGLAVVGEKALHALPNAAGFLGDLGVDALAVLTNLYRKKTGSDLPPERLQLPGMGPVSEAVQKSFRQGEESHGPVPEARNRAERILGSISEGAASGLIGGPRAAGLGVASGALGGAAAGATAEVTDNPYAQYAAGFLGSLVPGGIHVGKTIRNGSILARGASHPDFENFALNIVPELEGGGTIEAPKTNPKSGAFGPMQVTPETLRKPGYGIKPWNGTVEDTIRVGQEKLAAMFGLFKGDPEKALAAYNWGEGNVQKAVRKYGDDWLNHAPEETQNYVGKGMLRAYGGGDLPRNGSVRPMSPDEIAGITGDEQAVLPPDMIAEADAPLSGIDTMPEESARINNILSPDEPSNVTDITGIRRNQMTDELQPLIDDNMDFARRVHLGIDQGKITEAHIPNIEDAVGKITGIMDDFGDRFTPAQMQQMNANIAMLDDAVQRLGGDVHAPEFRNAADKFVGGKGGESVNDNVDQTALTKQLHEYLTGEKAPENLSPQQMLEALRGKLSEGSGVGHEVTPTARLASESNVPETPYREPTPEEMGNPFSRKTARQQIKDRTPTRSADGHDDMPPPSDEPTVRKLVDAVNAAKPLSRQQQMMISKQRGERFAKVAQIYATAEGPAAYKMAKAAMKGAMNKVHFEPIGQNFDANEIQFLFDKVGKSNRLTPGEKITGQSGLEKLLSTTGATVPTKSELDVLSHVFPKELIDATQKEGRFKKIVAETLNTPRTLMATADLSAPLRQGVFLIGRKEFYKAWIPMLRAFGSEKYFQASQAEIASRPTFKLMQKAGLALTEEGGPLTKREEQFMSTWVEKGLEKAKKVPVVGKAVVNPVRASSRAYMGFLNKLRADTFDTLIQQAANEGLDLPHDAHALHSIARFVNNATGRGDLGRWNTAAPVLNGIFFSPRLIASRVNLMNPVWYYTLHPFARRQALKSLLSFSATALTILGLAAIGGAKMGVEVQPDPRSSDFGKIKVGNTRYDILGGFQQYIRFGAQILTNSQMKSDGSVQSLAGGENALGKGLDKLTGVTSVEDADSFRPISRGDKAIEFGTNKFAPVPSFVWQWWTRSNPAGGDFTVGKAVVDRVTPLVTQDARDLYKDGGLGAIPGAIPGVFGVGVQTYTPREKKASGRPAKSEWDFAAGDSNPWAFASADKSEFSQ